MSENKCPCGYWASLELLPALKEGEYNLYCRGCDTYIPVKDPGPDYIEKQKEKT